MPLKPFLPSLSFLRGPRQSSLPRLFFFSNASATDPESFMKIKYRELEDDGYIPRTAFHGVARVLCGRWCDGRKGWHSPRMGRTKPGGHILKFSMTERASSYFIVSRFHRKFRAPLRLGRGPPDRHFPSGRIPLAPHVVPPSAPSANDLLVRYISRVFPDSPTWTHLCSATLLRSSFLTQYNAPRFN